MKLSPPKNVSWILAVLLGLLGIIASQVSIPLVSDYDFWFVAAGFGLLALATLLRGL
jgi:hypothetical protein